MTDRGTRVVDGRNVEPSLRIVERALRPKESGENEDSGALIEDHTLQLKQIVGTL